LLTTSVVSNFPTIKKYTTSLSFSSVVCTADARCRQIRSTRVCDQHVTHSATGRRSLSRRLLHRHTSLSQSPFGSFHRRSSSYDARGNKNAREQLRACAAAIGGKSATRKFVGPKTVDTGRQTFREKMGESWERQNRVFLLQTLLGLFNTICWGALRE
jgi:hypothetical protein